MSRVPANDLIGVTVVLLTCSYMGREFVRVGYYVNNEYDNDEMRTEAPNQPDFEHIVRSILAEQPRVTRFPIAWTKGALCNNGSVLMFCRGSAARASAC